MSALGYRAVWFRLRDGDTGRWGAVSLGLCGNECDSFDEAADLAAEALAEWPRRAKNTHALVVAFGSRPQDIGPDDLVAPA